MGRTKEALDPLRRADRLLNNSTGHPLLHGKIKLQIARGILASTGDRRRARALALEARALADTGGAEGLRELARINEFLEGLDA